MRKTHVIGLSCAAAAAAAFLAAAVALSVDGDEALAAGDSLVGSTALGAAKRKTPSAEERRIIEDANLVLDAVDGATSHVIAEILERGSAGAVQAMGDRVEVGTARGMEFASSIQLRIDLDEITSDGSDLHPEASGVLLVSAEGTLTGDEYAGIGIYDVKMTRETPVVYRDEAKRRTLSAPAGPGLRFHVAIAWNVGNPEEWTVSWASEAARAGLPLTLSAKGRDHHAVLSGELYETGMIGMKGKQKIMRSNVSGFRQVVLTDKEGQNTVRIDVENVDRIVLSVNGNRFGPHTAKELDREYGTQIGRLLRPEPEMKEMRR
ncbi:MAG: hypothetical protein ACYTKD_18950 [Planctomycetota bacterium]|jgi:hypothetical protein